MPHRTPFFQNIVSVDGYTRFAPVVFVALMGCSGWSSPPGPPLVALVTIDTWRLDHFSPELTPGLWALSEEGERFDNAWTPIGLTSPAHATMLTGLAPGQHGMEANNHHGYTLPEAVARVHLDERWATWPKGAFVSAYPAGPEGGLGVGFDVFDGPEAGERPGQETVQAALAWLPTDRSAWIWVHVYEPHGPYKGTGATDPERYAEEVRSVDVLLQPLLDRLVDRGSTIVVAADHGEVLLEERCGRQHERSTSDHVLRVPLFRWTPDRPGVQTSEMVGLEDVPALLRGERPTVDAVRFAESGICEPGCSPGCTPKGVRGRDRVAITGDGGRALMRGGRVQVRGAVPEAVVEALRTMPPVAEPGTPHQESLEKLGYSEP